MRIPKLRQGSYFPPFLEARKSSEKALITVIQEAWIGGVSTRRVANPAEANVVVSDGVVHFWGTVGSEEERTALRVVAENIPGVRGIEDHAISGPRYLTPLYPGI